MPLFSPATFEASYMILKLFILDSFLANYFLLLKYELKVSSFAEFMTAGGNSILLVDFFFTIKNASELVEAWR